MRQVSVEFRVPRERAGLLMVAFSHRPRRLGESHSVRASHARLAEGLPGACSRPRKSQPGFRTWFISPAAVCRSIPIPRSGCPRLLAFLGVVVGRLREAAHETLDNRDVLPNRARREANCPTSFATKPVRQLRVFSARAVLAEALRRLERRECNGAEDGSASRDRDTKKDQER